MASMWAWFNDTLHAFDDAVAGVLTLAGPLVSLVVVAWLRELLLRSRARSAALEHADDETAADSIEISSILIPPSVGQRRALVKRERSKLPAKPKDGDEDDDETTLVDPKL